MNNSKYDEGCESSSELSVNDISEEDSSMFIRKKTKKRNVLPKAKFLEVSPNNRFSRYDEKLYSESRHIAYLGFDHDRGCDVMWNVLDTQILSEENKSLLIEQLNKLTTLQHPNVNSITELWEDKLKQNLVFITDFYAGGSIRQYLYKIGVQKLKVLKVWLKMILSGLEYIHKQGLIFRDLNCGRIFYNNINGVVSIGDVFVTSEIFYKSYSETTHEIFEPNCWAPELLLNESPNEKTDIYSLGMVLLEMIILEKPYQEIKDKTEITELIIKEIMPSSISRINDKDVSDFIYKLIKRDPNKRPSVQELLNDEFLNIKKEDNRLISLSKPKKKHSKRKNAQSTNFLNKYDDYFGIEGNTKSKYLIKKEFEEDSFNEEARMISMSKKEMINLKEKDFNKIIHSGDLKSSAKEFIQTDRKTTHDELEKDAKLNNNEERSEDSITDDNNSNYQIFDNNYNVHLKFLINQDCKLHEIQFTYNLLRDNIRDLMEEIQNEFNFSIDHLNHIYETLKKISIYSKFNKKNNKILHDNSI